MTATMGPPPPKNPTATDEAAAESPPSKSAKATAMDPSLPETPNPSEPEREAEPSEIHQREPELSLSLSDTTENHAQSSNSTANSTNDASVDAEKKLEQRKRNLAVPYEIPPWSGPPGHHFSFEVLKDGAIVDQFDVNKKGAYMFGRVDLCDFVLDHPTISRFHAVLQFKSNGGVYLYDLGSTHGTSINKSQVKKRVYMDLHVGDVIRFGQSTRLYIFQGPSDLMPPEADLKSLRKAKVRLDKQDMEASLLRAKVEASRADGISWGMGEDAVEENEEDVEEITWQTYKGQLTDKQEKTRDKVIKRLEKIGHMKKEIDAIRAKDIAQGGLSQGQQTQIARNEQRIAQIMEELENLEETLNESIQESLGARAGKSSRGKKKGPMEEDEDDYMSDDDEFYDRTKKSSKNKSGENQSVETADSLLDKKDALIKRIEDKEKSLLAEDNKPAEINEASETGDELDTYMSAVSSQLVSDSKEKLQKEMSSLQTELDRILYLLKIADPAGEAARKRESKAQTQTIVKKKPPPQNNQESSSTSPLKLNRVAPFCPSNSRCPPITCKLTKMAATAVEKELETAVSAPQRPDSFGRFGKFGGKYVPETLMHALTELEAAFKALATDHEFQKELDGILKDYVGRESPLYFAERLTEHYKNPDGKGPLIYLKREDLNHTGAHKINNAVAQALLAKRIGKLRIIAETGAGQHGVATATVCARFGLPCVIYMGAQDMERQKLNVFRMRLLGAEVRPVHSGTATLKDATSEAIRDWVTNVETTHYILGSVAGPHPYPMMVRDFHAVIGKETRKQALEKWGGKPDVLVACVGGGSNAMGLFHEFVDDKDVRLIGVEAAGFGLDSGKHAATLTLGEVGVLHGAMSYLLQDEDGQIVEPHSISAGLDYPGVGPEHSFLKDIGRAEYHSVTDEEALEAFKRLSRLEGIIPALETSHAVAYLEKLCPTLPDGTRVVLNCSGRGDKDVHTAINHLKL